ncbi:hypothetical protein [Mesorhizobium shangrilense]|uniref:hypothetical protein n=1 Tax=Mesorhizobium shangrilense TaxID=460060 RepID=UPI003F499341
MKLDGIVIMDTLPAYKAAGVHGAIELAGATLNFLPRSRRCKTRLAVAGETAGLSGDLFARPALAAQPFDGLDTLQASARFRPALQFALERVASAGILWTVIRSSENH